MEGLKGVKGNHGCRKPGDWKKRFRFERGKSEREKREKKTYVVDLGPVVIYRVGCRDNDSTKSIMEIDLYEIDEIQRLSLASILGEQLREI